MTTTHDVCPDLTLRGELRSIANTRLPSQFYQLLQLAIPFAFQFWSYGLRRTAGWMIVVSLFGLWALCVKRLEDAGDHDVRSAWAGIGRSVTKGLGTALAATLAIEAFVRVMAFVFRCPGCAG